MKKKKMIRKWVQLVLFLLIAAISVNHSLVESGKGVSFFSTASLHAVCPFGGVVTIYHLLGIGTFVKKVHPSSVVLMIVVFSSAILLGPLFCGWICPFGTFQEWIGKIGKKLFKKKYNRFIPYKYDRYLRFLRYTVLVWVLYMTAVTGKLIFQDYDPYFTLFQFWTGEIAVTGFISLGLVILLSLFVERPFCKYACPYGAVLGIFNLFRIIPLRRNETTCIDCKACDRVCPMNLPVSTSRIVRNHQCISCYECTDEEGACPVPDTLSFRTDKYKEAAE